MLFVLLLPPSAGLANGFPNCIYDIVHCLKAVPPYPELFLETSVLWPCVLPLELHIGSGISVSKDSMT